MNWRKSSFSFSNGNCVEVAEVAAARPAVAVRDTADRDGPVLRFGAAAWREFAGGLSWAAMTEEARRAGPSLPAAAGLAHEQQ